jgi:hypothetical protein
MKSRHRLGWLVGILVDVTAVVLILDRSLSMPMNDFFHLARGRAVEVIDALSRPGCPDHLLALITVGPKARVTEPADLPDLEFDYEYGSNLEEALRLALTILSGRPGRVILVSDLVATAHTGLDGEVVFSSPPSPETLARTTEAIRLCADQGVSVEAWRYYNLRPGRRDDSEVIRGSILATGGKVEDIPLDTPGSHFPPEWTDQERAILSEAKRQGVRGYFSVHGSGRARLASRIIDKLRAKKQEGTLSDGQEQALETAEAWLRTFGS